MKPDLDKIPKQPGVYMMKDKKGEVVYIGKAVNLRSRVRSYFSKRSGRDFRPAARFLRTVTKDVEFIVTQNETEAFILENNLIKKFKPRFNIRLKDDKSYLSLRVDIRHPFPAIRIVRRPKRDGSLYFGPYSSSMAVRSTLKTLRTIIPMRDCSDREFSSRTRPCIKHQIHRCTAPCAGLISQEDYKKNLDYVLSILRGRVDEIMVKFERDMTVAAEKMKFEEAARFRDSIGYLKSMARTQKVEDMRFYDVDVLGVHSRRGLTEIVILFFREGKLISSQPFTFSIPLGEIDLVSQFLVRYYDSKRHLPEEVYIPFKLPDMKIIEAYLRRLRKGAFHLKTAVRGDRAKLLKMAKENARLSLKSSKASMENAARIQDSLRIICGLENPPVSIEGVDISTTSGEEAVGSIVHFKNSEEAPSRYRRYRIKTVTGMDDCAMIYEVVSRRLKRGVKEKDLPDLILVDGGRGQLNSALKAAEDCNVRYVDFLGIEKGITRAKAVSLTQEEEDRIVSPREGFTPCPTQGSSELQLLQKVRDEAHRFAITYHRKRRTKRALSSPLDKVHGLGAAKKKVLLSEFGGLRELRGAAVEEISGAPGIGPVLAVRIFKVLH